MNISIEEAEIKQAIIALLTSQGVKTAGKEIKIDFTAGRKPKGPRAVVSIIDGVEELKTGIHALDEEESQTGETTTEEEDERHSTPSGSLFN